MPRTKATLAKNEAKTLELVNTIRSVTSRKPIKALQKAFPSDSQACAIAKPVNGARVPLQGVGYNAPSDNEVHPWPDKYSCLTFTDEGVAQRVADAIGQPIRTAISPFDEDPSAWDVRLPVYASQFIEDFDNERYPHLIDTKTGGSSAFGA